MIKNVLVAIIMCVSVITTNAGYIPELLVSPSPVHVVSEEAGIDLTTLKVIRMYGPVTSYSVRTAIDDLLKTHDLPGDRLVLIDSPGGEVGAGQRLIDTLMIEHNSGTRIVCVAINNAHSMAFNIMSFCDVRLATAGTKMVAHKIAISYIMGRGTAKNLREIARELDRYDEPYCVQNSKILHLTRKEYDKYADRDYMWKVAELLKRNYLDGIAVIDKE